MRDASGSEGTGWREATSIMGILADLFSRKSDSNTSGTERRDSADKHSSNAAVRVVGIGGCGSNAIRRMIEHREEGVEYIAIDTDDAFLSRSKADRVIHIDTADSPEEAMREASLALQGRRSGLYGMRSGREYRKSNRAGPGQNREGSRRVHDLLCLSALPV